jgi:hypothetical protein
MLRFKLATKPTLKKMAPRPRDIRNPTTVKTTNPTAPNFSTVGGGQIEKYVPPIGAYTSNTASTEALRAIFDEQDARDVQQQERQPFNPKPRDQSTFEGLGDQARRSNPSAPTPSQPPTVTSGFQGSDLGSRRQFKRSSRGQTISGDGGGAESLINGITAELFCRHSINKSKSNLSYASRG